MKTKQNKKSLEHATAWGKEKKLECLHIMSPNKRTIHSCEELGLGTNESNFLAWQNTKHGNCSVVGGQGVYKEKFRAKK